jgi:beta-phosphoglucomutase
MDSKRAVLFDVDGVLVDSAAAHFESWRVAARELGREMTRAEFDVTFGRTSRDIVRHFFGDRFDDAEIQAIDDRKEAAYREIVKDDYPLMPGARELVLGLHEAAVLMGLGSSGPRENVQLLVDHVGTEALPGSRLFGAVITGFDVTRGKPDPQVFQLGAARLGVEPARCIVVEDAASGIQAAKAGGMKSVALASTPAQRERLAPTGPDLLIESLAELTTQGVQELLER